MTLYVSFMTEKKLISSVNTNVNTFIHFKYILNAVDLEEYIQIFKVASY